MRDPFRRTGRIVQSLADDDFYKFSMLALIHSDPQLRDAETLFAFKNRTTSVEIGHIIPEEAIRRELDHVTTLQFNDTELRYLGGHFASEMTPDGETSRRMFEQSFVDSLRDYKMSPYHLTKEMNGTYTIEASGPWFSTTLWEIHVLQVMAQLYFEHCISGYTTFERQCIWAEAQSRLLEKVQLLKRHPEITLVDFGTRRRACSSWQQYVNEVLLEELGPNQYRGSSNVRLSMALHTVPMGTFAHELPMGMSGILHGSDEQIRESQNTTFDLWWAHFGQPLSVALSDTYGTDFFLETFGKDRAAQWKGTRQDSGDPFEYGEKLVAYYDSVGVNPREKLIVFSDGLDVHTIVELYERFSGRIGVTFGWGTNLTNDFSIGGHELKPLSLVMKLMACHGHRTVKLSDNLDKAMGKDEDVERFKKVFGYTGSFRKKPRY